MITCQTAQMLEALAEEKKINAIGFTKHGRKILEDQEQALVRDYNAFDRQIAREKGEALEDYNQRKEELTGTYFKLMVDNSVGTLDPKQIEKEKTAAQRRFQKSQNYLLQDQENRVVGFRDKTFPQMIDFIVAGGFQSGGPDTDPATTAKISSSTKGISVVAEALAGKSGVEIPALQTPLTKEQYEEWVERSKDGEGVEYLNSFSLGSDAVPPELFKRLGIPSDSAEGIAVMDVLDGAMRENLQKQALKQRYEEYDTLLDRAKSQKQDPKELARIRALSNSMAGTSLAEAGIPRESVLNQHLDTLVEDPRLQVGFTDKDLKTQDNRTLAKSVHSSGRGQARGSGHVDGDPRILRSGESTGYELGRGRTSYAWSDESDHSSDQA